jgi:hypothetical protein
MERSSLVVRFASTNILTSILVAVFAFFVISSTASAADETVKMAEMKVGDEPLEIYEGSIVFGYSGRMLRQSAIQEKFTTDIVNYLTGQHAMKGYDENISRVAAQNMLEASIVAKLLSERDLRRVAKIKGAKVAVFVDKDGRIHFKEILVYDPKGPVYCRGEGRLSVRADSGIPCLTKKKSRRKRRKTQKVISDEGLQQVERWREGDLPKDAREIVEKWRHALSEAASATPVKKVLGRHPGELLELPDQELWPIIWSQSKQTLIQEFTFLPQYGSKIGSEVTGEDSCSREVYSDRVCKRAEAQNLPPQQVQDELDREEEENRQHVLAAEELNRWCGEQRSSGSSYVSEECKQSFRAKCDEFEIDGCALGDSRACTRLYYFTPCVHPPGCAAVCTPAEVKQEQRRRDIIAAERAARRSQNSDSAPLITGFTWDKDEKWSKTKRTCVGLGDWCSRYWITAYYQYSFVFGLRIPLLLEVESSNVREDDEGTHTGEVTFNLTPFNGDSDDYAAAGMPDGQIYSGREALASLCHRGGGCGAGLKGDLPGPNPYLPYRVHVEEINLLHKAFSRGLIREGEINPPDVGAEQMLGVKEIDFDLMGEMVSLGVVGAEILPLLRLDMGGQSKTLGISYGRDTECAGSPQHSFRWDGTGDKTNAFTIYENSRDAFLYKPSYTFDLTLKLGLEPALWVDFGIWDDRWSFSRIWLPWGISTPDYTLDAHRYNDVANTHCGRRFPVTREVNNG